MRSARIGPFWGSSVATGRDPDIAWSTSRSQDPRGGRCGLEIDVLPSAAVQAGRETTPSEADAENEQDEGERSPAEALPAAGGREVQQRSYAEEPDLAGSCRLTLFASRSQEGHRTRTTAAGRLVRSPPVQPLEPP
jgi:hypothetical protein